MNDHQNTAEPVSAARTGSHRGDYYRLSVEDVDRIVLHDKHIGWWQRVKFHLFAQTINQAVKRIIARSYESSQINSHMFHQLNAIADRAIFPQVRK